MEIELLSEVVDEIKTGDLIAFRVEGMTSKVDVLLKLYQKFGKAKYSHVGVAVRLGRRVFVVEATPPWVTNTPLNIMGDFFLIPANLTRDEDSQIDYLLRYSKVKYSLWDLFTRYLGFEGSDKSLYCSELAGRFYKAMGLILGKDAGHTPDSIAKAIEKSNKLGKVRYIISDRGNLK